MYFISGFTQQLVCPYIVSGRMVAATKYTGLSENFLQESNEKCMKTFMRYYFRNAYKNILLFTGQ
jgi:hypothetical protein